MPTPVGLSYASTETMESTLNPIVISVDPVLGSDLPTVSRPARVLFGDLSAEPFLTLQAAFDSLPRLLRHNVRISLVAGTFGGLAIRGVSGYGKLEVVGTWSLATGLTGTNTGTAGAGSSGNLVNKPGAAPNWATDELRGKWFVITAGGGFTSSDPVDEVAVQIRSNTTTQITLAAAVPGLDGTTVFNIVNPGSVLSAVPLDPNSNPIKTNDNESFILGTMHTAADVRLHRLVIDNNAAVADYTAFSETVQALTLKGVRLRSGLSTFKHQSRLEASHIHVSANATFTMFNQAYALGLGWVVDSSSVMFDSFNHLDMSNYFHKVNTGVASGLIIRNGHIVTLGGDISNCTALPLELTSIGRFSVNGAVTGANPGTTYGVQIGGGGLFRTPGLAIAGAGAFPVRFESIDLNYAQISGNGSQNEKGTVMASGTTYNSFPGFGIIVGGSLQVYGLQHNLGNNGGAKMNVTAKAGGGLADNTPFVGFKNTIVKVAASAGDSIRFFGRVVAQPFPDPPAAEVFPSPGMSGSIVNAAANAVNLYPQETTRKIFLDGVDQGNGNPISIPAGKTAIWMSWSTGEGNTNVDWYVNILP